MEPCVPLWNRSFFRFDAEASCSDSTDAPSPDAKDTGSASWRSRVSWCPLFVARTIVSQDNLELEILSSNLNFFLLFPSFFFDSLVPVVRSTCLHPHLLSDEAKSMSQAVAAAVRSGDRVRAERLLAEIIKSKVPVDTMPFNSVAWLVHCREEGKVWKKWKE